MIRACDYQLARNPLPEQERTDLEQAVALMRCTQHLHPWHIRQIRQPRQEELDDTLGSLMRFVR